MYQKSPFPYLFILVGIITLSSFSTLTLDKQIDEPIVYIINKKSFKKELQTKQNSKEQDKSILALSKQ